jgi:subtilisin family serine protease
MKRTVFLTVPLLFFLFLTSSGNSKTIKRNRLAFSSMHEYVPGEILIKYKTHTSESTLQAIQHQRGLRTIRKFAYLGIRQVKLPPNIGVKEALYLEVTTPNDAYFTKQWGLNNTEQESNGTSETEDADIDAPEAWDITTGNSHVVIAVIDSGVDYNHPDLSDNLWVNAGEIPDNGIDDDDNGYIDDVRGWDFAEQDNNPIDAQGHGTHVTGIIAAKGNNIDGITGVCWAAQIMPLRVSNALGFINIADEISAIDYAIRNGAKVINASLGGYTYSRAEKVAIAKAGNAGILFVTPAGNRGTDNDSSPHYPSNYNLDNIIVVASTGPKDNLSSFSNYGHASVDVGAPGEKIYSTRQARQIIWQDDFDDGDMSDWTTGGINDTWGITDSVYYSGSYCLAESPDGNYLNDSASWALAPVIDLTSDAGAKFEFKIRGDTENLLDFLSVQTSSDGLNWMNQKVLIGNKVYTKISGSSAENWFSAYADLGKYYGCPAVYIRFYFISDLTGTDTGWHIDNVKVTAASSSYSGSEYQYLSGTSMAAPYLTGIASLVWGFDPALTSIQVKDIILNSVDSKASLMGKTITGGRINALNALPPLAPSGLDATAVSSNQINLSWIDNSTNELGFKIERKKDGASYSLIETVSSDTITYNDTSAKEKTSYIYRVRAYNSGGNSDASNEAFGNAFASSGDDGAYSAGGGCSMSSLEPNRTDICMLLLGFILVAFFLGKRYRSSQ